jgi:hypothetical protein
MLGRGVFMGGGVEAKVAVGDGMLVVLEVIVAVHFGGNVTPRNSLVDVPTLISVVLSNGTLPHEYKSRVMIKRRGISNRNCTSKPVDLSFPFSLSDLTYSILIPIPSYE